MVLEMRGSACTSFTANVDGRSPVMFVQVGVDVFALLKEISVTSMLPLPQKNQEVMYDGNTYEVMAIMQGVIPNAEANAYTTAFNISAVNSEALKAAIKRKSAETSRKINEHFGGR